jgi:protein PsiE
MDIGVLISRIERSVIFVIILLTVLAVLLEIWAIIENRTVSIADILLLFLYTEVVSMAGAFYNSRRIPTVYPLLIAITALSRLIVLQSKEMEPATILYEAGAILVLTAAVALLHLFTGEREEPVEERSVAQDRGEEDLR